MLFKKLSTQWAEEICRTANETDAYKIAMVRYVFESILSFCLSVTVLVIVAWILGIVKQALLIGLAGAVIKSFTGGLHMSTPLRCAVTGAIALAAISYLSIFLPITIIPMVIVVLILIAVNVIVWLKAPVESKGKPLTARHKAVLAVLSKIIILLVSIACLFWTKAWGMNEVFYGMIFQVLNLLDGAAWGTEKIDDILGKIERKPVF
jgi:accessory gene regulator B